MLVHCSVLAWPSVIVSGLALNVAWGRLTLPLARTSMLSVAPGAPITVTPITLVLPRFTSATKTGRLLSRNSCKENKLLLTRTKPPQNDVSAVRRETTSVPPPLAVHSKRCADTCTPQEPTVTSRGPKTTLL